MDDGGDGGKGGVEAQEGFTVRGAPPPPLAASLLTDNASPGGSPFRDQRNASTPGQTSLQSERPPIRGRRKLAVHGPQSSRYSNGSQNSRGRLCWVGTCRELAACRPLQFDRE